MKTLLVEGKIPPHTECPFKAECNDGATGLCVHQGKAHGVPFSCGAAWAFDLIQRQECRCSLRTKLVGDGCEVCNPEYAKDMRSNAKVSGAGTASAGLPGYAGDNNGERK